MKTGKLKGLVVNLLVAAIPIGLGLGVSSLRAMDPPKDEGRLLEQVRPDVQAMRLVRKEHAIVAKFIGTIEPIEQVEVASELGGTIVARGIRESGGPLEPGDEVKKGSELLKLDDRRLVILADRARAGLEQANAAEATARAVLAQLPAETTRAGGWAKVFDANLKRAKENLLDVEKLQEEGGVASLKELRIATRMWEAAVGQEQIGAGGVRVVELSKETREAEIRVAEAAVRGADAAVKAADAERSKAVLHSPIDGTVAEFHSTAGEMALPTQPLVTVVRLDSVKLVLEVIEKKIHSFRAGQRADIHVRSLMAPGSVAETPSRIFRGTVSRVSVIADPRTGMFEVEVTLPNERAPATGGAKAGDARPSADWLLKPGMTGHADIIVDTPVAYGIPVRAVSEYDGRRYVWALEGPKGGPPAPGVMIAKWRTVTVSRLISSGYLLEEVPDDLRLIILEGHDRLQDGGEVRVINHDKLARPSEAGSQSRPSRTDG